MESVLYKDFFYCKRCKNPLECSSEQELLEETSKDIRHRFFHQLQRQKLKLQQERNTLINKCFSEHTCEGCKKQCKIHLCLSCKKDWKKIEDKDLDIIKRMCKEEEHTQEVCKKNNPNLWKQLHP